MQNISPFFSFFRTGKSCGKNYRDVPRIVGFVVIKTGGHENLAGGRWLESVEGLRRPFGRSPQPPLVRRLALICLNMPEERSWSRCFYLPLPVFSSPHKGKTGREEWTEWEDGPREPPHPPHTHSPQQTWVYISWCIMSVPVWQSYVSFVGELGRACSGWPGTLELTGSTYWL